MELNTIHVYVLALLLLVLLGTDARSTYGRRLPVEEQCTSSLDCGAGRCCRDGSGRIIGQLDSESSGSTLLGNGTCSSTPSGPGGVCGGGCGCTEGHTCYRTVTGACCPPMTCWRTEDARRDDEFWKNCFPPTCFFPPSANPGDGPMLL